MTHLLEDDDGAPYPDEIQRAVKEVLAQQREAYTERIEATILMLYPEEMTPTAARLLRAVLGDLR